MDNMKLLRYARAAAFDKWWHYDKIATQYAGHRAESLARKMADEAMADVNTIAEMIRAEKVKRRLNADVIAELKNLAEKNFETAKREVHNGNVIEAHVYEQGEGQRVPVMGILSGKL